MRVAGVGAIRVPSQRKRERPTVGHPMRSSGQAVSKVGTIVASSVQIPDLDCLLGAQAIFW